MVDEDLRGKVAKEASEAGQTLDEFGAEAFRAAIARAASRRLAAMGGSEPDLVAAPRRRFD